MVRQCGRGETPLHIACRGNNVVEVKRIIQSQMIEINVKDLQGRTPLYAAVGADATEVIEVNITTQTFLLIFLVIISLSHIQRWTRWFSSIQIIQHSCS